jgi:muramoyltetrapeptide carboxypeptidase
MIPPKLEQDDLVAIISPSNTVIARQDRIAKARQNFEQATGLRTVLAPNALGQHHYSAGTTQQRVADFHWALENPEVKAIVFSCGGQTAIDLVDKLDYQLIKENPKVIAGISDATTLMNPILAKTGLITFLGLEFLDFAEQSMPYEVDSIKKAWFDGELGEIRANPQWRNFDGLPTAYRERLTIREGQASGQIVGGNYSSFAQLCHTEYLPDLEGAILVVEHYLNGKAGIHRSFAQLRLWGVLDKIKGLIIGYCLGSDDPAKIGNDHKLVDLVLEATDDYDFRFFK